MTEIDSIRRLIARETRTAHERLHTHPLIGRLVSPQLTTDDYMIVLRGFRDIYCQAEARRSELGFWSELSLADQCLSLRADCGGTLPPAGVAFAETMSASQMLGVLYALHGAEFGASVIRKNLDMHLPDAPKAYFARRPHPEKWRNLTSLMESCRPAEGERRQIVQGALTAFSLFHRIGDDDGLATPPIETLPAGVS